LEYNISMKHVEAFEIIEEFHKSIKDLRPEAIVQSFQELPYPASWIKYAHFVLGENLINNGDLSLKMAKYLIESYSIIDSIFVDDPEPVNVEYRKFIKSLRSGQILNFAMPNPFGDPAQYSQFLSFIEFQLFNLKKVSPFVDASGERLPLDSFVYQAVLENIQEEKDLKHCRDLVNSGITRSIDYPGKKQRRIL